MELRSEGETMRIMGIIVAFLAVVLVALMGSGVEVFIDIPSLIFVVVVPMALSTVAHGWQGVVEFSKVSLSIVGLGTVDATLRARMIRLTRNYISYTYASGVIGTMMGSIMIMAQYDRWSLEVGVAEAASVSMLTLLYAVLINELKMRPLLHAIIEHES
jgi:flagellar motor component MotA